MEEEESSEIFNERYFGKNENKAILRIPVVKRKQKRKNSNYATPHLRVVIIIICAAILGVVSAKYKIAKNSNVSFKRRHRRRRRGKRKRNTVSKPQSFGKKVGTERQGRFKQHGKNTARLNRLRMMIFSDLQ